MYDVSAYDWCFHIVPQVFPWPTSSSSSLISKPERTFRCSVPQPHGKVLGGSNAIYQMEKVFTSRLAFDAWEKMDNPGWNWEAMKPYLPHLHTHHESRKYDEIRNSPTKMRQWSGVWPHYSGRSLIWDIEANHGRLQLWEAPHSGILHRQLLLIKDVY